MRILNLNVFFCFVRFYAGFPVVNDPLYNHEVFGPAKGRGGDIGGKTDDQLVKDLINIHNAENWLGIDGDSELSLFKPMKADSDDGLGVLVNKGMHILCTDTIIETSTRACKLFFSFFCFEYKFPVFFYLLFAA